MYTKLRPVFTTINDKIEIPGNCIRVNLNPIVKRLVLTMSNNKSENIIVGGYNKQYSQPTKKELSELEK